MLLAAGLLAAFVPARRALESARDREAASRRVFTVTARGATALQQTRAMRERLWRGVELGHLSSEGAG